MTLKNLIQNAWRKPEAYFGFSPDGDFILYNHYRDSHLIDESNWDYLMEAFKPEDYDDRNGFEERPTCYIWSAGCSLVGWVEYMMIRHDAPWDLKLKAEKVLERLSNYPILDEDDHSRREWEFVCESWQNMSLKERVHLIQKSGSCSIFAARRDEIPEDHNGYLFDYLRSE